MTCKYEIVGLEFNIIILLISYIIIIVLNIVFALSLLLSQTELKWFSKHIVNRERNLTI